MQNVTQRIKQLQKAEEAFKFLQGLLYPGIAIKSSYKFGQFKVQFVTEFPNKSDMTVSGFGPDEYMGGLNILLITHIASKEESKSLLENLIRSIDASKGINSGNVLKNLQQIRRLYHTS